MKKLLLNLFLLLAALTTYAQTQLKGKVVGQDNEPLVGAAVQIMENKQGAYTDENGFYVIPNLPNGQYSILVNYVGYEVAGSKTTIDGTTSTVNADFQLKKAPISFDEIVVRATRATDKLPITFTNLKKEVIEANNLGQDVPYLLKWTPSTVVTSDAGTGIGYTGIRIRGVDPSRINVTINGIPLNDAESQGVFWVNLPDFASSTDNIQIQRGVGTSTNGPAAFGASINLNTSVLNKEAYGQITSSVGSFNTQKANISFGTGLLGDKFSLDGRLSKVNSDGYIDRASVDLSSYYLSGAYVGRKNSIRMNVFSGHEVTYQAWNGVPVQYLDDEKLRTYNSAGTQRPGEPHDNEVDDYQQSHYQILFNNQLTRNWDLSFAGNYTKGQGFFELYKGGADFGKYQLDPIEIGGETITSTDLIERRWLDNDFYFGSISANFSSNDKKTNLNLGTAYSLYKGDHFGEVIWARNASNTEQDHRYYENDGTKNDYNLFAKASHQFAPKMTGFIDLQYRKVDYEFLGFDNDGSNVTQSVDFNFFNPKVGLTYELAQNTSLYAYFGVGNKEPNRSDFTDSSPASRPVHETLYDTEIGFKKNWRKATLEANLYYMDYKNQLVLTGQLNDVGENNRINVPESYRAGLEVVGGIQLTSQLSLEGAITLSDNKVKSFTEYIDNWDTWEQETVQHENSSLAFSPNSVINANLSYEVFPNDEKQKLNFGLSAKAVGKQYIDNTSNENTILDAYNFADFRMGYSIKTKFVKEVAFTLLVRNIFDARYSTNAWTYRYISQGYDGRPDDPTTRLESGNTYNLTGFYPQAGRNFLLGVSLKF